MLYYTSFEQMLILHALMGIGFTVAAIVFAAKRNSIRRLFVFGNGLFGEQARWVKWYSWAFTFESVTSFLGYQHTQMLYYELGMSIFQAAALVVGAFFIDRVSDFFTGDIGNINIPKPDLSSVTDTIKSTKEVIKDKIHSAVDNANKISEDEKQKLKEQLEKTKTDFNNLIKGH